MATQRLCSIPDCDKPHLAKSFCAKHYQRFLKHGNIDASRARAENGAPQEFYKNSLTYEGDECLIWPYSVVNGYGSFLLDGRLQRVSRRVCEDANGPPPTPKHEAAHSCGKGHLGCVTKRHLTWKTPKENSADRTLHGTHPRGENHYIAKLTEEQAREIIALKGKATQASLASRFGVSFQLISQIQRGKTWAWLHSA